MKENRVSIELWGNGEKVEITINGGANAIEMVRILAALYDATRKEMHLSEENMKRLFNAAVESNEKIG